MLRKQALYKVLSVATPQSGARILQSLPTLCVFVYMHVCTPCPQKTQTPVTFWRNFTNTALVLIILGVENLHLIFN